MRSNIGTILQTDYGYTGQRKLDEAIGLMDYKFRFYSPTLGRFILPDNIIPDAKNPQTWNRYSYVNNRPINFNDPTGHRAGCFKDSWDDGPQCRNSQSGYLYEQHDYRKSDDYKKAKEELKEYGKLGLSLAFEPADWAMTLNDCRKGNCSALALGLMIIPGLSGGMGGQADEFISLIRGGDRPPSNPKFWFLRERDLEEVSTAGLSVFKNPPVNSNYLLNVNPKTSLWWNKTAEIDIAQLPKNLEWKNTTTHGFFNDTILDNNHFVIRDLNRLTSMNGSDYLNWWNTEMASHLADMFK